jgi:hypothetical protein
MARSCTRYLRAAGVLSGSIVTGVKSLRRRMRAHIRFFDCHPTGRVWRRGGTDPGELWVYGLDGSANMKLTTGTARVAMPRVVV